MENNQKDRRVPIMMTTDELNGLDEWRSGRRIWSRGEAIRQLIAQGIEREQVTDVPAKTDLADLPVDGLWQVLPEELRSAINEYRSSRPWLENETQALVQLAREGLALVEDRDDVIELPPEILEGVKEFSGLGFTKRTALRMLEDAIGAWRARREDRLDDD